MPHIRREPKTAFGQSLRTVREQRGISITALAEAVGLSGVMLRGIEAGDRLPSYVALHAIARVLRADLRVTKTDLVFRRRPRRRPRTTSA